MKWYDIWDVLKNSPEVGEKVGYRLNQISRELIIETGWQLHVGFCTVLFTFARGGIVFTEKW